MSHPSILFLPHREIWHTLQLLVHLHKDLFIPQACAACLSGLERQLVGQAGVPVCQVDDAAVRKAGLADEDTWPMQFFASRDVFDEFLETLAAYEECYRITDRWYEAFMLLGRSADQEGFVTSSEIAARFAEITRGLDW